MPFQMTRWVVFCEKWWSGPWQARGTILSSFPSLLHCSTEKQVICWLLKCNIDISCSSFSLSSPCGWQSSFFEEEFKAAKKRGFSLSIGATDLVGFPWKQKILTFLKTASHFRLHMLLIHQQVSARVVELFFAQKCHWTWVTLSSGFSECGSLVWRVGVCVLRMYFTRQRKTLPRGRGGTVQ